MAPVQHHGKNLRKLVLSSQDRQCVTKEEVLKIGQQSPLLEDLTRTFRRTQYAMAISAD